MEDNVSSLYNLDASVQWIKLNKFSKVCVQFSEDCLHQATPISTYLTSNTDAEVFIAAENDCSGCCVDQVVAEQAGSDAIIHFGDTCNVPISETLPTRGVPLREPLDIHELFAALRRQTCPTDESTSFCWDTVVLDQRFEGCQDIIKQQLPSTTLVAVVYTDLVLSSSKKVLYIGSESRRLTLLMMKNPFLSVHTLDPKTMLLRLEDSGVNTKLRRRLYLIDLAKGASVVGILIGSFCIRDRLALEKRVKETARGAGKKVFTFSIKKVTPQKLANFPEIDIFVYIGCPYSSLFDCGDFYKPLIMPYEFHLACNPSSSFWSPAYGLLSTFPADDTESAQEKDQVNSEAPDYHIHQRSWKGLVADTKNASTDMVEGLSGTAQHYNTEPCQ